MERHKPDFVLLVTILCLVSFGLVMVYSSSIVWAIQVQNVSPSYFFKHQLESALIGLTGMTVFMNMPFTVIQGWAKRISLVSMVALFAVLVPHIGYKSQGVRRWIGPPSLHFQPSEFALVAILIYLAYIFDKNDRFLHEWRRGVRPPLVMLGLQFLLILLEPDMGTGMLLLLSGLTVMFAAGIRWRHIAAIGAVGVPAVFAFAKYGGYRAKRLQLFMHTWDKAYQASAYQLQQSLIAMHHGGVFGQGLGRGVSPFLFLPIPYADFIFAVIVEELGIVGAAFLLALFALLVWRGIRIALSLEDRFASLLAMGISALIGWGVVINVGAASGLMPITGIPLPFISYGGTALMVKLFAMGILLSLSRHTREETAQASPSPGRVTPLYREYAYRLARKGSAQERRAPAALTGKRPAVPPPKAHRGRGERA
jgi:cell division protein FtsW